MRSLSEVLAVVPSSASWKVQGVTYWFISEGINFGRIISSKDGSMGTLEVSYWKNENLCSTRVTGTFYPAKQGSQPISIEAESLPSMVQRILAG